jgi:uncharacterized coiled-coil protein SlyX
MMVRKYNPEVKTEYGRGLWDGCVSHDAVMTEEKNGQWVTLKTFGAVTSQQRKRLEKQQAHINALQARIKELTHGVQLNSEPCPCCGETILHAGEVEGRWAIQCEICFFEGPAVPVKSDTGNERAQKLALVAWNKRSVRQRKADAKSAE